MTHTAKSGEPMSRRTLLKSLAPAGVGALIGPPPVTAAEPRHAPAAPTSPVRRFKIDASVVVGPNTKFWQAAGSDLLWHLTPRPAGQSLLDRMRKTKSCRFLRNHYTFNEKREHGVEIGGSAVGKDGTYRFDRINRHYVEFVKRGIKPIVEYDFIPSAFAKADPTASDQDRMESFIQSGGPQDWSRWAALLKAFTANLVETFGLEEVRTWYFEVWNEPDFWPVDAVPVFYRIYDVFADAVKGVDSRLRIGGPAAFHDFFLRGFLHHITQGVNHVTGQTGSPIDFVSYHSYGISGAWLHAHPLVRPTVNKVLCDVLYALRIMKEAGLKGVEFHLNEWGLASKYSRTVEDFPCLEYRNSEFSALFLAKLAHGFFAMADAFKSAKNPTMAVSPSLMLYWGFSFEADGDRFFRGMRDLTTAGNLPKPIQTAQEMLALLGDARLKVSGPPPGGEAGLIATRTGDELQFLAYLFNEYDEGTLPPSTFEVQVSGIQGNRLELSRFVLDNERHNSYRAWQRAGSPRSLKQANLPELLRAAELTPELLEPVPVKNGTATIRFDLPRSAMCLYTAKVS